MPGESPRNPESYSQLSFFARTWCVAWYKVSASSRKAHEPSGNHIPACVYRHTRHIHERVGAMDGEKPRQGRRIYAHRKFGSRRRKGWTTTKRKKETSGPWRGDEHEPHPATYYARLTATGRHDFTREPPSAVERRACAPRPLVGCGWTGLKGSRRTTPTPTLIVQAS